MNPEAYWRDEEREEGGEDAPLPQWYAGWFERYMLKSRVLQKTNGPLSEVQSQIIDSCLARGDRETADQMIQDWNSARSAEWPVRDVSKWTPGDHYYALTLKFDSLEDAIDHLNENGFRFGRLRERFEYRESGG